MESNGASTRAKVHFRDAVVHVIQSDTAQGELARTILAKLGLTTAVHNSAAEFLGSCDDAGRVANCVVVNLDPDLLQGATLSQGLASRGIRIPVVFLPGLLDGSAITAENPGSVGLLEMPFILQQFLPAADQALGRDSSRRVDHAHQDQIHSKLRALSRRERDVMELVVRGQSAAQIATQLGIAEKTASKHRSRVYKKLEVDGPVQLVRIVLSLNGDSLA